MKFYFCVHFSNPKTIFVFFLDKIRCNISKARSGVVNFPFHYSFDKLPSQLPVSSSSSCSITNKKIVLNTHLMLSLRYHIAISPFLPFHFAFVCHIQSKTESRTCCRRSLRRGVTRNCRWMHSYCYTTKTKNDNNLHETQNCFIILQKAQTRWSDGVGGEGEGRKLIMQMEEIANLINSETRKQLP